MSKDRNVQRPAQQLMREVSNLLVTLSNSLLHLVNHRYKLSFLFSKMQNHIKTGEMPADAADTTQWQNQYEQVAQLQYQFAQHLEGCRGVITAIQNKHGDDPEYQPVIEGATDTLGKMVKYSKLHRPTLAELNQQLMDLEENMPQAQPQASPSDPSFGA